MDKTGLQALCCRIELDKSYFNAAKTRIEKAQKEQDFINSVLY